MFAWKQNSNQKKTDTMFKKEGGKVTNKVSKGFAIAKPSRGTVIEVNAIGKCICLGKCVEIVIISSVYSWITKNVQSWHNPLSRMWGIGQEC